MSRYSHAENVPGLTGKGCLAIVSNGVPNMHALVSEINSVYCDAKQGHITRTTFGQELQPEAREGERFLWTSTTCNAQCQGLGYTPQGPHLSTLIEFVEKGLGHRRLRGCGPHAYGRGAQALDTGHWDKGFDKPTRDRPCIYAYI